MGNCNMRFVVASRLLAVVCVMVGAYFAADLVEEWDHYGMVRRVLRVLACMGWGWLAYDAYTLRLGWLRRFVGSPK